MRTGGQTLGALTFVLFTGQPAGILVGPGNSYVAQAAGIGDLCPVKHFQVMDADIGSGHNPFTIYGSLFLGNEASVTCGDTRAGSPHVAPHPEPTMQEPGQ